MNAICRRAAQVGLLSVLLGVSVAGNNGFERIRYGMIGLDVTDRIRQAATVTEQGIEATGAALPAGSHSMSVEIADSAGRSTKQAFKFRVEK